MQTAEAPPPPVQIEAIPNLAFFSLSTFIKEIITLAPLIPTGCPIATAPP